MKFTILLSLLPLLVTAAPTEPQAAQIGPAITYPFQPDSSAIELSHTQVHAYEKRLYKETYYVDLYNKNYMWVLIQDDKNGSTAVTTRWEHRAMLASGGPSYSSAAPTSSASSAVRASSSVGTPRPSAASSSPTAPKSSSASTSKPVSSSAAAVSKPASSSAPKPSSSSSTAKPVSSSSAPKPSSSSSVSKPASSSAPKSSASSSVSKPASSSVPKPSSSSSTSISKPASSSAPKPSSTSSSSAAPAASASAGVSAADQAKFLTLHNDFRAKYSAGSLVWDTTLADFALKTAQSCKYGHTGGPYGENIAAGVGGGYNIDKAFSSWANEDALYDFSKPGYSSGTGHFTQIVWKGTARLGCAAASCADGTIFTGYRANSTYVVCEYQSPGNVYAPNNPTRTAEIFTANVGPKVA